MSPCSINSNLLPLCGSTPLARSTREAATSSNTLQRTDNVNGDINKNNIGVVEDEDAIINEETSGIAKISIAPSKESTVAVQVETHKENGLDHVDNRISDTNRNYEEAIDVNVVSQSTHSIDVLSGGESDTGNTLGRSKYNNNSLPSSIRAVRARYAEDPLFCLAKELLLTERTYKRDLETITITWTGHVSSLARSGDAFAEVLARPCLALGPLAVPQSVFLARLEKCLAAVSASAIDETAEPGYKKIIDILYDHISSTYDAYMSYTLEAGGLVARVESVRRSSELAQAACAALELAAALPLSCLMLRPLHRLLYYDRRMHDLPDGKDLGLREVCMSLADAAREQLRHAENHAALCQLRRDITGYDHLLIPGREFIRLGCVYKHSTKGLQQRMLFLFSDLLISTSKAGGAAQFRAHDVLPLHGLRLQTSELRNSFTISNDQKSLHLTACSKTEYQGWYNTLQKALEDAPSPPPDVVTDLNTVGEPDASASRCGAALAHVCWHRATSLAREQLHQAMTIQLSGYLLRKFKKSHGWQKLWVVFAAFSMYFYKSWQDDQPLVSLPLLGYSMGIPDEVDAIQKDFVFKLQFKNHVYFFRADSQYTFKRWMETLQHSMSSSR